MIVKYLKDGVCGYIDNIRQVANKDIDCNELLENWNAMPHPIEGEPETHMNGNPLPELIRISNIVFSMAMESLEDEGINRHAENLIDGQMAYDNYPASVILMYIEDCKEYDAIVLVTNQKAYLMNDKGQTIERLI